MSQLKLTAYDWNQQERCPKVDAKPIAGTDLYHEDDTETALCEDGWYHVGNRRPNVTAMKVGILHLRIDGMPVERDLYRIIDTCPI